MIKYKSPYSSLFLVLALLSACTLNADVHDNNLNEPDPTNAGGAGGSDPLPSGGSAGENVGGSAGVAGEAGNAGVGGSEAGSAGEGGSENYPDAGVAGSGGEAGTGNDAGAGGTNSEPDPVVRVCDTPEAVGSDKGNWFTTNTRHLELRPHWFQLIDADGFSGDGCTYVGRIKWYHPVTDQLGYVWYESTGLYDNPLTIFTIDFTNSGLVADGPPLSSNGDNSGTAWSRGSCVLGLSEYDAAHVTFDVEYQLKHCIYDRTNYHGLGGIGMFRGEWDDSFSKPVLLQPLPEPYGG